MNSADLAPSPLWQQYQREIAADLAAGVSHEDSFRMNCAIKMRDLSPYEAHRKRLDETIWSDAPGLKTVIDLGAGYGAMAKFWPDDSSVYNVDLPEMLEYQQRYVLGLRGAQPYGDGSVDVSGRRFWFIPITEADSIPLDGAYLFSAWALTETTRATWEYWIDKARCLAGAYILGHRRWSDEHEDWPWSEMLRAFNGGITFQPVPPDSWELAAVNR